MWFGILLLFLKEIASIAKLTISKIIYGLLHVHVSLAIFDGISKFNLFCYIFSNGSNTELIVLIYVHHHYNGQYTNMHGYLMYILQYC